MTPCLCPDCTRSLFLGAGRTLAYGFLTVRYPLSAIR
jgi:hypothetical protein